MIDTIKPMNIDLTKNLHGHVRVETRDRWTGRVVDSQEKDNLITNAVQRMMQASVWGNRALGELFTPIFSKALGGVFLFDNTLTESASNIYFPASAKLVAYAGQEANSSLSTYGSYNAPESVYTANGFTTVWDFATSQANGTIASLARTTAAFSSAPDLNFTLAYNYGYGSPENAITTSYDWIGYDEANKYGYIALNYEQTKDGVVYPTTNIYRVSGVDFTKINLLNCMPPASQLTLIKTLSSSDGTASASSFVYDQYDNNFVYITGTTIHLIAMDGTHTTKTATGTSGSDFCVTENYYWRVSSDGTVYRIEKANTANVQTFSVLSGNYLTPSDNDVMFAHPYSADGSAQILYPDGDTVMLSPIGRYRATYRQVGSSFYSGFVGQSAAAVNIYPTSHYLGTIANLDSPVTKTSSQTMKIIYTLTEA